MLFLIPPLKSQVLINEVMSKNTSTFFDEDEDSPDWIELFNSSSNAVTLEGWNLSDNPDSLRKWQLPQLTMPAGSYLLILASGKDRKRTIPHWQTLIRQGDQWSYRLGSAQIPANWKEQNFNDSSWVRGPTGIGYGDGDDLTQISPTISLFARKRFQIQEPENILNLLLHIDFDDAFVAYLNGQEIARSNIGQANIRPAWNQGADSWDHEAKMYRGLPPDSFDVSPFKSLIQIGENVLAVEVHNYNINSSDLTFIPYLSVGTMQPIVEGSEPPEELNLKPVYLHTNFKLSQQGETLILSNGQGEVVDQLKIPALPSDVSYGREAGNPQQWVYFEQPTPGAENLTKGFKDRGREVIFSSEEVYHSQEFFLELSTMGPGQIYFTQDGSIPDSTSTTYERPIKIDENTVVRARVLAPNLLPGPVSTRTFLFDPPSQLPTICLTTAPENLWDEETGIYVLGTDYDPNLPYWGANFWQDWERPVHMEFWEPDLTNGFEADAGMKIFGAWSRARPQKSLAIFARKRYGSDYIEYPLFPNLPFDRYHSFVLRNSGNDWERTMFADGFLQTLAENLDLEIQAYRPCRVYLNGEYWGILNLREKINEAYLEQHFGIDRDALDLLELDGTPLAGSSEHYTALLDYVSSHDLSVSEYYAQVQKMMDVENFITYQAFEIYIDNRDWPGNNIKYWRPQQPDGRWRWILFDTDFGFGLNAYGIGGNQNAYSYNTLEYATSPTQTPNHWGNPPWATFLLRKLLENQDFKQKFINRFADLMNSTFKTSHVLDVIDSLQQQIALEMERHYQKWSQPVWWIDDQLWWNSFSDWYQFIAIFKDFARYRPAYMRQFVQKKFGLPKSIVLELQMEPAEAGEVKLNDFLQPDAFPFIGFYFAGNPITLKAIARSGFEFSGWSGAVNSTDSDISLIPGQSISLTAHFRKVVVESSEIVINEINYHSAPNFDPGDWIELYNRTSQTIDLSGWFVSDSDSSHVFRIPGGTYLNPETFVVVCVDSSKFRSHFPDQTIKTIGNMGFGLSGSGDQVKLFNGLGLLVDSVQYDDQSPWPSEADGQGPTLELVHPDSNNVLAKNWQASQNHGSPGRINSVFTGIEANSPRLPSENFRVLGSYPNPFNQTTHIQFQLTHGAMVKIQIYDVRGQLIRHYPAKQYVAGRHSVIWDGTNDQGTSLSSGLYFCRIQAGLQQKQQKLLLIR